MAFDLHIKNIGKLTDAKLRIGRFTVLAGPNNTGKSFVSKILYSLFDAMNANHLEVYVRQQTDPARELLQSILDIGKPAVHFLTEGDILSGKEGASTLAFLESLESLHSKIGQLEQQIVQTTMLDSKNLDPAIPELIDNISEHFLKLSDDPIVKSFRGISEKVSRNQAKISSAVKMISPKEGGGIVQEFKDAVSLKQPTRFSEIFRNTATGLREGQFVLSSVKDCTGENLIRNFQIPSLGRLRNDQKRASEISLEKIGKISLVDGAVNCEIDEVGLHLLNRYSKVLYLDSPMLWRLKSALESIRLSERHTRTHRERLTGIPGYFYDLASNLRSEYTGEMDFPELHANLTGKNVLGGKLVISDTGEILFRENDRNVPLALTATGVINLGVLALLIERKILDKESFVFIDEPEAHLHPAWQVVMAESLFDLAKGGAHVVIATHSIDMLKWLEVHAKKNPEDKELIALNQFSAQNEEDDTRDFDEKMAGILQELTAPFAKTFREGV